MHKIIQTDCERVLTSVNMEKLANKTVLITGASGLVGIYLLSTLKLIKQKYNIDIWCWIKNDVDTHVESIFKGCNIIKSDITCVDAFKNLPKFDFIIHSAGYGQPLRFLEDKIKTIQVNTETTINLFNMLALNGRFLFLSSSEIYNGINETEIKETQMGMTTPDHTRACYIESKKVGETICHAFIEKGYDVKIARLSTAYGPGTKLHDRRVLNSIIEKGLTYDVIQLMDDGSATRVFCYISDVIEMLLNISLHGKDITYNVAGIYTTSILNIANIVGNKLNCSVLIPENNSNSLAGNPKTVNINIDKYKKEFNKKDESFVEINYGLEQTINWIKHIFSY